MYALSPELEKYLSTFDVPRGDEFVTIHITDDRENSIKRVTRRRYAYALQTVANIIGIKVEVSEEVDYDLI